METTSFINIMAKFHHYRRLKNYCFVIVFLLHRCKNKQRPTCWSLNICTKTALDFIKTLLRTIWENTPKFNIGSKWSLDKKRTQFAWTSLLLIKVSTKSSLKEHYSKVRCLAWRAQNLKLMLTSFQNLRELSCCWMRFL